MNNPTILGPGSRVRHAKFGLGVVVKLTPTTYQLSFVQHGLQELPINTQFDEIIDAISPDLDGLALHQGGRLLERMFDKWGHISEVVPLGSRWQGGTIIIKPADESQKPKEIPIEAFFHKIIMVRDRLRVMEQRINSSNLTDEEKINLQQYITRIYGSLTTFNLLFKEKDHQFKGVSDD